MNYLTSGEMGQKWGIGIKTVTLYCEEGRIKGAVKKGNLWLIPEDAARPLEEREEKSSLCMPENACAFQSLYENKELFAEIIRNFPYPIHICTPDGTLLLANEAFLKFAKISDTQNLYKKHNILLNPDLERWGIKDFVTRAFQGEIVHAFDVEVPYQEIVEQLGKKEEPVFEKIFHNITCFPIRDNHKELLYIITVFTISRYYLDSEEIMKGKQYIDNHWKDKFDINKLADFVYMSGSHYSHLFKLHTGLTPYKYYQNLKINKIKEKLCDKRLSISEVFSECGVDYNGNISKLFKQKTGMSPSLYRKSLCDQDKT